MVALFGYGGVFATALILDMFAQLLGPDLLLFIGILGNLSVPFTILAVFVGSALASLINYAIGKTFAKRPIHIFFGPRQLEKAKEAWKKYVVFMD